LYDRSFDAKQCLQRGHLIGYLDSSGANAMSHQPPKQEKKKPQLTPKEKKAIKQQKKHVGGTVPLIRH
jgi:hypothetical protein